ncbi:helix-turn-helix transcriptional regulator [Carnobacterium sp. ISL-102]|uniref:helix-turn-helix domain-containing protein n=1 Tax=Carnobacterium sp. ISL-102 TaxID=2819142 RepID=UPI001BEB8A87|nr:helix-turn-helix transcriptional regulator [Carnobacterium sp. ISL-102]MBT2732747.1 helix-turn-helix transcriptional regulator [Carnobacterium sp. ISL-102]
MENKLKHYFDTQMGVPEFAEAWKETEASYQAANILLRIREEKRLTKSELTILTGKKQSYIFRVEKGTQNISVQTLSDIVESVGLKLKLEVVV